MTAYHLEILVEEESMEAFLQAVLPRLLPKDRTFSIHTFQGKHALLHNLESRLRAYARWITDECRIIVLIDRDRENCFSLKQNLETIASATGLLTRSQSRCRPWQLVNRVVIEELEAWYFGDWQAVRSAYPRVSQKIPNQTRNPDAVRGGTWETFERILKRHGYFKTGLRKVEAARVVGTHVDPGRNRSHSFVKFREAIIEATA